MSYFYIPWKRQETYGFLPFSGGIEMWHWTKMGSAVIIGFKNFAYLIILSIWFLKICCSIKSEIFELIFHWTGYI